ncbi:MAG: 2-hydroxychromene-2-carboxylate isomerase [Burkholderiales bacterium]|nr:2-hydroxychromene-2-carboxylate isomerase [Burkholderiales bacterium]
MADPIEFYFDFSSPYGYFAATRLEALAARHGRGIVWRPILLGAVFKITGQQPLPTIPLKGSYIKQELARTARLLGVPFKLPSKFPIAGQAPSRAYYWLHDRDPVLAVKLVHALFRAYFAEDRDISNPEVTANVAAKLGLEKEGLLAALNDPAVKERLKTEVEAAIERGVFGSPFFIVDREPFWGQDRMDQIERWLETGGW